METLEGGCSEASRSKDQSIKKVHFKEIDRDPNVVMVVDLDQVPSLSWKERLMGKNPRVVGRELEAIDFDDEKDFVLIEGDGIRFFINDFEIVYFQGPWIIYGQYLTIQLWTMDFDPTQPYPSVVMSWIHLPETLMEKHGHQWKRSWLEVVLGYNGARPLKGTKTFESERAAKKNGQVWERYLRESIVVRSNGAASSPNVGTVDVHKEDGAMKLST
ncbi:hypothetical protein PVK06_026752 [Gossypium arboreum]|uniref:DUF4283 domain-containing protein n=1 Tax=Gossypium arboreum TaxID=29729 RepID=A0ABR0P1Z8_GOSAR|nr:hypothetical protein PVK06_026752 [Gossypium arboreum]